MALPIDSATDLATLLPPLLLLSTPPPRKRRRRGRKRRLRTPPHLTSTTLRLLLMSMATRSVAPQSECTTLLVASLALPSELTQKER